MLTLAVDATVAAQVAPPWRRRLRAAVARMVRVAATDEGRAYLEVALRLVDDAQIHLLNHAWRKKDRPTDVLAFAQRDAGPAAAPGLLGDIVISVPTARAQARGRGPAGLHAELCFLAAHGLAHLLGFDHQTDAEEHAMNARMSELMGADVFTMARRRRPGRSTRPSRSTRPR